MTKELSKKEKDELAIQEMQSSDLWGAPQMTKKDIVIPRLLLMQPMSEKVTGGSAAFGDIVDSLTDTKVGGFDAPPVRIVPFLMQKTFVVFDANDPEDKKFLRIDPITPENEDARYEDEEKDEHGDIIKISRVRTMTFYVLLEEELKKGSAIPYIVAFAKTSLNAGKKLATQMYVKNVNSGKTPAGMVMGITVSKQSQDKKTWAIFDMETISEAPMEYQQEAFKWLKLVKSGETRVDEGAFEEEAKEKEVSSKKVDTSGPSDY